MEDDSDSRDMSIDDHVAPINLQDHPNGASSFRFDLFNWPSRREQFACVTNSSARALPTRRGDGVTREQLQLARPFTVPLCCQPLPAL